MNNFISIDPSGMGKNGYFKNYSTGTLQGSSWITNYDNLKIKIIHLSVLVRNPATVYIEDIKYTFDKVGLETITTIKLIGAIELYCLENKIKLIKVTSDQVKSRAKWFKELTNIQPNKKGLINLRDQKKLDFCNKTEITWEKNKYYYKGKHINAHQRDAILIYFIGLEQK